MNRSRSVLHAVGAVLTVTGLIAAITVILMRGGSPSPNSSAPLSEPLEFEVFAPAMQGYPAPGPTLTAVPQCDWQPVPQGVSTQIVTLSGSPDASFLEALQFDLDQDDAAALADRAAHVFVFRHTVECNGSMTPQEIEDILAELLSEGSCPLIQGYFRKEGSNGNRSLIVFISGWSGSVANPFATPDPEQPFCASWPVGTYAWFFRYSAGDDNWTWHEWVPVLYPHSIYTYDEALNYGTYYVIRP